MPSGTYPLREVLFREDRLGRPNTGLKIRALAPNDGWADDDKLPDETYAEMRVIRVREHTAMVLVTASTSEVERSARLIARKGY